MKFTVFALVGASLAFLTGCDFEGRIVASDSGEGAAGGGQGGGGQASSSSGTCGGESGPTDEQIVGDCRTNVCTAKGEVESVVDDTDLPPSDKLPCTRAVCTLGEPSHVARLPGEVPDFDEEDPNEKKTCFGVCQGGLHEGKCGLQLHSRGFPSAGAWSTEPISMVAGWKDDGNAPPPNDIVAAEWLDDSPRKPRLMVWTTTRYHERQGGAAWRASDINVVFPELDEVPIAAVTASNLGMLGKYVVVTTSESPIRAIIYKIDEASGSPLAEGPLSPLTNETVSGAPNRAQIPSAWAFAEQRLAYSDPPPEDAVWTWSSFGGQVYAQQFVSGNYIPMTPVPETSSGFEFGSMDAPAPNTTVAAYYDASVDQAFFIAP